MAQKKKTAKFHVRVRYLMLVVFLVIALYVIVPQLDQFGKAFDATNDANMWLIVCAGLAIAAAIASAATVYVWLALKPVKYRESLLVQTAGMFVNRLLPAGIGGMGLSGDFLYHRGHSLAKASTVVLFNNILTFLGHMTLLLLGVLWFGVATPQLKLPHVALWIYVVCGALVLAALILLQVKFVKAARRFANELSMSIVMYRSRVLRLVVAFVFALGNTLGHAVAIALCMYAFGLDLSPIVALVVLTGGVAAASVTPTPGGLIGSEAGLTAVLVGYGVEVSTALAVALSYRLVSYWLPLIPGVAAFWYAQTKRLI